VQSKIKDEYRGRVFAFYDVAVNAGIITGAVSAALLLPANGATSVLPAVIALAYFIAFLILIRKPNSAVSTN
jgi:predicted MFS family arabinose efflux permease